MTSQRCFTKASVVLLACVGAFLAGCAAEGPPHEGLVLYDLSHKVPTFQPTGKNVTKANLKKPYADSVPTAGFNFQAVRKMKPPFKTGTGFFQWAWFYFDEHYSTHLDSTDHYQNNTESREVLEPDNRSVDKYQVDELVGPIVYIDISERVANELAKNGGKPSPDPKVTNFGTGGASVTVADLEAVETQITNGSWLVLNLGWSQLYQGRPPKDPFMHPYINGLNYPGLGEAEVQKLIDIQSRKGVKIAGIVADNLSIDSGESGLGSKKNPFGDGWAVHRRGLQRGWKLVENASGLDQLKGTGPGQCSLVVGAAKLTSASGVPARLIAMCRAKPAGG